mmetsp:Transcript_13134/g.37489  ORF Transcript_13134/g.37489 Transcript_13134/m.37489 type:complete len:967 (+) Transcript_13134:55-2955(+)
MVAGLLVCSEDKVNAKRVPLRSVHANVIVSCSIAQSTLRQTYENVGPKLLETCYVFPLPEGVTVTSFSATFSDGRELTGVIKERQEAKDIYRAAVKSGTRAALLEEERPDVFQASIGCIQPRERVVVVLQYCQDLMMEQDAFRLTIPSHVAPRYTPVPGPESEVFRNLMSDSSGRELTLLVTVEWDVGNTKIGKLESPTHPSLTVHQAEAPGKVSGRFEGGSLDSDLVLTLTPVGIFQPTVMWEEWSAGPRTGMQALMLSFVPKFELPRIKDPEVIFVADCSGSMSKQGRIQQSKQALHICLNLLPEDCRFNIVKFGSSLSAMSTRSVTTSEENLWAAASYINGMDANMGGTEMLQPLRFALESLGSSAHGSDRQIFLFTDGKVANEQAIIDFVRGKRGRIFSFGLGSGVSTFLVNGVARATSGNASFLQDGEKLGPICASMLRKSLTPAISNLEIKWPPFAKNDDDFVLVEAPLQDFVLVKDASQGCATTDNTSAVSFFDPQQRDPEAYKPPEHLDATTLQGAKLQHAPKKAPAIFAGSHFCAFALYPEGTYPVGKVELTGETPAGRLTLNVQLAAAPIRGEHGLVHRMAARALIRDLEEGDAERAGSPSPAAATRLSREFSILCRSTAFVAVDKDGVECGEVPSAPQAVSAAARGATAPVAVTAPTKTSHEAVSWRWFGSTRRACFAPRAVTNAVSWRSEGVKHEKNEVFLEVKEELSLQVGADGSILKSDVQGALQVSCCLSGMPELKLGLNEMLSRTPVPGTVKFHQCVRLGCFELDNILSCIPPDGNFEMLQYKVSTRTKPPIQISTSVSHGCDQQSTEYTISVKSAFKTYQSAGDLKIWIPLPGATDDPGLTGYCGEAKYVKEQQSVFWRIGRLQGEVIETLSIRFRTPLQAKGNLLNCCEGPTITMCCKIKGLAASGLQIRYLKIIEKSGYKATQQVRYTTTMQDSQYRIPLRSLAWQN